MLAGANKTTKSHYNQIICFTKANLKPVLIYVILATAVSSKIRVCTRYSRCSHLSEYRHRKLANQVKIYRLHLRNSAVFQCRFSRGTSFGYPAGYGAVFFANYRGSEYHLYLNRLLWLLYKGYFTLKFLSHVLAHEVMFYYGGCDVTNLCVRSAQGRARSHAGAVGETHFSHLIFNSPFQRKLHLKIFLI